jgi:hypothetical protein
LSRGSVNLEENLLGQVFGFAGVAYDPQSGYQDQSMESVEDDSERAGVS